MPLQIKTGSLQPFEQWIESDFSQAHGFIVKQAFHGVSIAQMQALQQDYVRAGISCSFRIEKGLCILTIEDSTQQFSLDTWQLVGSEDSISGLSHPILLNLISDNAVAWIISCISNPNQLEASTSGPTTQNQIIDQIIAQNTELNDLSSANQEIVFDFIGDQMRGQTDFRQSQYVLRHSSNVPNNWVIAAGLFQANVNCIYTAGLLGAEISNTAWSPPCPNLIYQVAVNIPNPYPATNADTAGYLWGWLKSTPTYTLAANNRIDISNDYTLALWNADYYAIAQISGVGVFDELDP